MENDETNAGVTFWLRNYRFRYIVKSCAHPSKIATKTVQLECKGKKAKKEAKQEKKEAKEEKKDELKRKKKAEDKEDKQDRLKEKKTAEDREDKQNGLKQKLRKEKEEEEMKEEKREEMKEEAKMEIKEEVKAEIQEKADQATVLHRSDMIWSFRRNLSYVSYRVLFLRFSSGPGRRGRSEGRTTGSRKWSHCQATPSTESTVLAVLAILLHHFAYSYVCFLILKGCRPCRRPLTEETAKLGADGRNSGLVTDDKFRGYSNPRKK